VRAGKKPELLRFGGARPRWKKIRRERAMLTALVLVCSLSATPDYAACNKDTADYVMLVPGSFNNPTTCYLHGQAYLAGSEMGRSL